MYHSFLIHSSADACLGYYKQCCDEHWGTRVSFNSGFLSVYAQKWDCWVIRQFYFQFSKESPHCWNMYNIIYETNRQSRFDAWYWMLGAGALGRPRGMVWGGRREEGSGWGTHVYLWQIHLNIWQNQYNIVKLKNKIKIKYGITHTQKFTLKKIWIHKTHTYTIRKLITLVSRTMELLQDMENHWFKWIIVLNVLEKFSIAVSHKSNFTEFYWKWQNIC